MTEAQQALARRAVACKAWRWMPGMIAMHVESSFVSEGREHRVFGVNKAGLVCCLRHAFASTSTAFLPGLQDPATLGCLLALVREAWATPDASVIREDGWWDWSWDASDFSWKSEEEALVAALEAAP